jgi:secreted trypsin-like serine protease
MATNWKSRVAAAAAVAAGAATAFAVVGNAWAIYGGSNADEQYPFMASVQFKTDSGNVHWCGGSLISTRWVVTAKHCMLPSLFNRLTEPSDLQIRIGSADRTAGGDLVDVSKIIVHGQPITADPTAGQDIQGTDIALLKLAHPVTETPVAVASAPPPNTPVRALGWGLNCRDNFAAPDCGELPTMLRQLDSAALDRSGCVSSNPDDRNIVDREICLAAGPDGAGIRSHDSGGPLLDKVDGRWELVGAASGPVSQRPGPGGPTVYADVTAYRDWIDEQTA